MINLSKVALLFCLLAVVACKKTINPVVDVYVAGYEYNPLGVSVANVWKNGVITALTNGQQHAIANSVYVSGNDVYVSGNEYNGSTDEAILWKNGQVLYNLSQSNSIATSVFISGADVYVVGFEVNAGGNRVATLWKNGVATTLTNGQQDASANSVYISGADVYVAGYESNGTKKVATIWKNGVVSALTNGQQHAYATSIFVVKK